MCTSLFYHCFTESLASVRESTASTLTWLKMKTSTSSAQENQTVFTCWPFHFWGAGKNLYKNTNIEINTDAQKRFDVSLVSISMGFQREQQQSQSLWKNRIAVKNESRVNLDQNRSFHYNMKLTCTLRWPNRILSAHLLMRFSARARIVQKQTCHPSSDHFIC